MDKKNTMLLTVIAVATLLVAVVGATFAYFTATVTQNEETTAIQATSGNAGTVVLNTEESALKIHLTATDMANPGASAKGYYAVLTSAFNDSTNRWDTSSDTYDHNVLKVTATNSDSNTVYTCSGNVKAVLSTDAGNLATLGSIVDNDGELVLTGINGTTLANGTIKLSELVTAGNTGVSKSWSNETLASSATPGTETSIVKAHLLINNTTAEQDYLEDLAITITLSSNTFVCAANGAA